MAFLVAKTGLFRCPRCRTRSPARRTYSQSREYFLQAVENVVLFLSRTTDARLHAKNWRRHGI